jgi:hypothetical protein
MRPSLTSPVHFVVWLALIILFGLSCSGRKAREARLKERDEVIKQSRLYCQFLSGEDFPDIDVKTNIEVGKKCDESKPLSLSHYVTPSKISGVLYCCNLKESQAPEARAPAQVKRPIRTHSPPAP